MAAQGEQDFKWLATMDSEAIISTMAQLKPRDADKNVPVALTTKKRTPRKRTKSVKAAEADEVADLLDADSPPPAKKACADVAAALTLPANPACGVVEHSQVAGSVPLFKPVSDQTAGATFDQQAVVNHVPVVDDGNDPMPVEEAPTVDAIRAPDPVGPAVPTWTAQHVAPVEQMTEEGAVVVPPEPVQTLEHDGVHHEVPQAVNQDNTLENNPALAVPVPEVPVAGLPQHPPAVPAMAQNAAVPTAEMIYSQHIQQAAAANAANVLAAAPPVGLPNMNADGADAAQLEAMHAANEAQETLTKYTGVRKNKGGRFSARIKLGGVNRYLGSFATAEEAARAFDAVAIQNGRPVETLNFPAAYGGPTVGQAYRKRKVHKLYEDPSHQINVLLQKLADVDRSNPGILRLTMGTLGVPENRYMADNKYSGVRQQSSHWETRIRYKDKLYSMGFYASVEAAALAWDITAASLQRCRKLNFPEVSFTDLEQQLDALKCVISQAVPAVHALPMPAPLPLQQQMLPDPVEDMMDPGQDQADPDDDMHPPADIHQQEDMHQQQEMHQHEGMHQHDGMHQEGVHQEERMHQQEGMHQEHMHQQEDMHPPHVPGPSDGENEAVLDGAHSIAPAQEEMVPSPGEAAPHGPDQIIPGQPLNPVDVPAAENDAAMGQVGMVPDQQHQELPESLQEPAGMGAPPGEVHQDMAMDATAAAVMHHEQAIEGEDPSPDAVAQPPPVLTHAESDVTQHDNIGVPEADAVDDMNAASTRDDDDMNSTVPESVMPSMEHLQQPQMEKAGSLLATTAHVGAAQGMEQGIVVGGHDDSGAAITGVPVEGSLIAPEFAASEQEMQAEFPAAGGNENMVPSSVAIASEALATVRAIVHGDGVVHGDAAKVDSVAQQDDVEDTQAPDDVHYQPDHSEGRGEM